MQAKRGRMIGDIEVTPLWDGPLPSSLGKILAPQHRLEAEELIRKVGPQALTMEVYGFLLKLGDRLALIDTGAGRMMSSDLGKLLQALGALQIAPEQIEFIFMTHLHRDHFGGLVDGEGKAAFPNAEILVHETEATFWLDNKTDDLPLRARRYHEPTVRILSLYADRLRRIKDDDGVAGVSARLAPGHTPGHTCWLVRSGRESLLAWGDLIHLADIHLPAPYISMEYDLDPETAKASRMRVLGWVANDRILVAGAHLPFPGIGAIVRKGSGFAYEPDRSFAKLT